MMALKFLLMILAVWAIIAAAGLLAAHLSGHIGRAYPVTPPDQAVDISGESQPAAYWAERYRPVVLQRSIDSSPPLLRTLYEVIERADTIYFVYYQVWEDEVHPNRLYHNAYRLFRAAYYGSPVRDIEYFEIKVDRKTGKIAQMMFETSPGEDYNVTLSEHLIAYVTPGPDGGYSMRLTRKNGEPYLDRDLGEIRFEGQSPVVGPVTWNHLTKLISTGETSFDKRLNAPLEPLTDDVYSAGKFARKSHGTFETVESGLNAAAGMLGLAAIVIPLGVIMRAAGWVKQKTSKPQKQKTAGG